MDEGFTTVKSIVQLTILARLWVSFFWGDKLNEGPSLVTLVILAVIPPLLAFSLLFFPSNIS